MIIKKNKLIKKIINILMVRGKKKKAELIIIQLFKELKKLKKNPLKIITIAIFNLKPLIKLKIQKKRKFIKIIPKPIKKKIQISYAIKSLILQTNKNKNNKFTKQFIIELLNAYNNNSNLIEQKKLLYKKANENKSLIYQNKKI